MDKGIKMKDKSRPDIHYYSRRLLKGLRLMESAVFTGMACCGLVFSFFTSSPEATVNYVSLFFFILAIFSLSLHIFLFNDYTDFHRDRHDINKKNNKKKHYYDNTRLLKHRAVISAAVSLLTFAFISNTALLLGCLIIGLSLIYSSNTILFVKGKPGISTLLHFLGGVLGFLLGYIFFNPINREGIIAAVPFSILLCAGHLIQEAQDYEGDKNNKIKTLAILIGQKSSLVVALCLILSSHIILAFYINTFSSVLLQILNIFCFFFVLSTTLFMIKKGFTYTNLGKFRKSLRLIYACFCLSLIILMAAQRIIL